MDPANGVNMKSIWLCAFLCMTCGCRSTPWERPGRGDPSPWLAKLDAAERSRIELALEQRGEAGRQVALAYEDLLQSQQLLLGAEREVEHAEARLADLNGRIRRSPMPDAVLAANPAPEPLPTGGEVLGPLDFAEAAVRFAHARLSYCRDLVELAERRSTWTYERVDLSVARYELCSGELVARLDVPGAAVPDLGELRRRIVGLADRVARCAIEVHAADMRARLQQDLLASLSVSVPEAYRPLDVPAVDDAFAATFVAVADDPLIGVRAPDAPVVADVGSPTTAGAPQAPESRD